MPSLRGVVETSLYVEELERSVQFYRLTLGLVQVEGDARFCALHVGNGQLLLLFRRGASSASMPTSGGPIPAHDGIGELHVAFAIAPEDLAAWETQLRDRGVPVESRVCWPRGGVSIYFRDPDRHLIELATPGLWTVY